MSVSTKNYKLVAFTLGDVYSAKADKRRMSIIDNQLAFVADLIGDGIVTGFEVSGGGSSVSYNSNNEYSLNVLSGEALIGRSYSRNFGELSVQVKPDNIYYLFIQGKRNYVGSLSGFSPFESISFVDNDPPATPSFFTITNSTYNSVTLQWETSLEVDFDHYIVYRSLDNVTFSELDTVTENSYIDEDVEEQTQYYYKISSVDVNGNESTKTTSQTVTTGIDLSVPLNVSGVVSVLGNQFIQLVWSAPQVGQASSYSVETYLLDDEGEIESTIGVVSTSNEYITIDGLTNGRNYKIIIYSISPNSISSEGLELILSPVFNSGPDEITNLLIADSQNVDNSSLIDISSSWNASSGANKYVLTIIENGEIESDPIEISSSSTSYSFSSYLYHGFLRKVLPRTNYIVKVQAVDSLGRYNAGKISKITTNNYVAPAAPSSILGVIDSAGNLVFTWKNSVNSFDYNIVSITKRNITTNEEEEVVSEENIGKKTSYLIAYPLSLNSEYTLEVKSVDGELESSVSVGSFTTDAMSSQRVDAPSKQFVLNGDKEVYIGWSDGTSSLYSYFKIWRAEAKEFYSAEDFVLVDTVPAGVLGYVDYSVENDKRYVYFVTGVDVYGRTSLNPVDDGFFSYNLCRALPHADGTFLPITDTSLSANNRDVNISWETSIEDGFDGFEIYCSVGNKHEWEKVGYAARNETQFIHYDALIRSNTAYYYMVRKYRNEVRLVLQNSSTSPVNSIPLAKIVTTNSSIEITDLSVNISNLERGVLERIGELVESHTHEKNEKGDYRIDLSGDIFITQWETADNQIFTTTEDFGGADSYKVYINDVLSDVFFEVDAVSKRIVFASQLDSSNIKLECVGLSEIQGILAEDKIQGIVAASLNSGKIRKEAIPQINHLGRMKEELVPLQLRMISENGYEFFIHQNLKSETTADIGTARTFYDFVKINNIQCEDALSMAESVGLSVDDLTDGAYCEENLSEDYNDGILSVTSDGILVSFNKGATWAKVLDTKKSVHKLYYSSVFSRYFALASNSVYASKTGLSWYEINGLDGVGAVRDITEDVDQVYISTSSGVFVIQSDNFGNALTCSKTHFIDSSTSNCYAIACDQVNERILVSTEIGIFETFNGGTSWSYSSELEDDEIIYNFFISGNYLFALGNSGIWREELSVKTFSKIAYFENVETRKLIIFSDRFVVSSSSGILLSDADADIYVDDEVELFVDGLGINTGNKIRDITAISIANDRLYIGSDNSLFDGAEFEDISQRYSQTGIIPSIYINGERKKVGVYYSVASNSVFLDNYTSDRVSVANQYVIYKAKSGGWVGHNFYAGVNVYLNDVLFATAISPSVFTMYDALASSVFDSFTDENSNLLKAEEKIASFNSKLQILSNSFAESSVPTLYTSYIADMVNIYHTIYGQLNGETKYFSSLNIDSNDYTIIGYERFLEETVSDLFSEYELVPTVAPLNLGFIEHISSAHIRQANASDGTFIFRSTLDKYDVVTVSLSGTTLKNTGTLNHEEIDDSIENFNSGMPAGLSEVYHSNLVKLGIFLEKQYNGEQDTEDVCGRLITSTPNAKFIVPRDRDWYDIKNSTVDYNIEKELVGLGLSLGMPSAVVYYEDQNSVLVASGEKVIAVNDTTLESRIINIDGLYKNEYVRNFALIDDSIYVISNSCIFYSSDLVTWNRHNISGLSGDILDFKKYNQYFIAVTSDGIYTQSTSSSTWVLAKELLDITLLYVTDYAYVVAANKLYYSSNGTTWSSGGDFDTIKVNDLIKYKTNIAFATNSGLRYDNATAHSGSVQTSLIDLLSDLEASGELKINSVALNDDGNDLYAFANNGKYYKVSGGTITEYNSDLPCIHYGLCVNGSVWVFGYNLLKVSDKSYSMSLSTGVVF